MKSSIFLVLLTIMMTVLVSGCVDNYKYVTFTSESPQVSFEYPEGWNISITNYTYDFTAVKDSQIKEIDIAKDEEDLIGSPSVSISVLKDGEVAKREADSKHFVSIREGDKIYNKSINGINCRVYEDWYTDSWEYFFKKNGKSFVVSGSKDQNVIEKVIETIH